MQILILIYIVFGQIQLMAAQTTERTMKLPKPKGNLNCFYKPKYSSAKRSQFYPFSISDTIKIVSFRYHRDNYPVKKDTLLADSLIEAKTLSQSEIDRLTDILYNNFYKRNPNYAEVSLCFYPRNAILFLDTAGNLKESILLCFSCDRYKKSSDRILFGDDCTQKMEMLRDFFISAGLTFGTDHSIITYPGENFDD